MSEESGGIRWETVVIVLCILGVFAAALVCAYRSGKARTTVMREFAAKNSWGFSRNDAEGISAKLKTMLPDWGFSPSMIVTVESGSRTVRLFDCSYRSYSGRDSMHFGTGCIVESPRFRTNGAGKDTIEIISRTGIDAALAFNQVDVGDSEFSKKFIVVSKNPSAAKNVVTPALQTVLLGLTDAPLLEKPLTNPLIIYVNAAAAFVLSSRDASPERMLDLVELCRRIEASMP